MRVLEQILPPGVEDRKKTHAGAQVLGVSGNRLQRSGTGFKQDFVDDLPVLEGQCIQRFRDGEDDMEVLDGQQFSLAPLDPLGPRQVLAFRTVAIAAGVVTDALMMTVAAAFHVAA